MLSVNQAEQQILDQTQPLDPERNTEWLELSQVCGRILAKSIASRLDFPHWDNSAMDGYAVRYEDVRDCASDRPVTLEIMEEIPAGYQPQHRLQPGQAARILTGSVMPAGADTVVMQEETRRQGATVTILAAPKPAAFVRHRASFYRAGDPLLPAGTLLGAAEIAVLAAAQCAQVAVYRRPRVAILSTGSELVGIDQPLQPGQIVDSNQYALAALVTQTGAEAIPLGIVPDQPEALKQAIAHAISSADVVLSSGGVSVGDYDYVDQILADLGAEIHFRAVAVKPGKPLTFATFGEDGGRGRAGEGKNSSPVLYFGLPGNPVSALVTFWRFVLPALCKLSGLPQGWGLPVVQARSRQELRSDGKRESYLWGKLHLMNGEYEFEPATGSHSSGNLINLAGTTGLAVLAVGQSQIAPGTFVPVMQVG
jgi:molybdopterin molybdotransferase